MFDHTKKFWSIDDRGGAIHVHENGKLICEATDYEVARSIIATHNALLGVSTKTVENAGLLQANLEMFLLGWDQWTDEQYAEDVFPRWILDLAGGLDYLAKSGLTLKGESYMGDEQEVP